MNQPVSPQALRDAMRRWATGVTIVTSRFGDIEHGMTVNSFASISLDPPTVLVAIQRATRTRALVAQAGVFGMTILAASQQVIADRFAGRDGQEANRFAGIAVRRLTSGTSLIAGGLAQLDCQVQEIIESTTHSLVIGQVNALEITADEAVAPLIYYNRDYRLLGD